MTRNARNPNIEGSEEVCKPRLLTASAYQRAAMSRTLFGGRRYHETPPTSTTKHPNDQTNEHRQTTKTKQTRTDKQPRPNKRAPANDQTNEHRQTTNAQTNEHPKSLRHFSSSLASVDNSDRRRACEGNVLKACSDTPLLQGSLLDRRLHHVRIQNDPHISQSSQRIWAPWMHNGPALLLIAKITRNGMALTNKQQTINNPRYLQSGRAAEA